MRTIYTPFKNLNLFVLILGLLTVSSGCAGNHGMIRTGTAVSNAPSLAAPTPVPIQASPAAPSAPTASDVNQPVSEADYQKALADTNGSTVTSRNLDDYLTIAQYQFNQSNWGDSLKTYQQILTDVNKSPQLDRVQYMVGQIYYQQKNNLPALSAFQNVLQSYSGSAYADASRRMMEFMIQYSLSLDDLRSFVANYPNSPLKCSTLFELGSHEAQNGDTSEAVQTLNSFIQQCPQHPSVSTAQLLLQSLQSQQKGKTLRLGVLAPLTGHFKNFGQSMVNGITLAFEQANQNDPSHKLTLALVQDTEGDSLQAVKLFQDMVQNNTIDVLMGPVVKSEIDAVAPLANQQKILLLSPTYPVDGFSAIGPYAFSNSMTNEMQGRAMARYAVQTLGLKRFGLLFPEDGYGQTLSQAFTQAVEALGATVTAQDSYAPNSTDFQKQLVDLGGQNPELGKENALENQRRLDELHYNLNKEIQKILFKAQQADPTSSTVALVSLAEALGNTGAPSVVKDINDTLTTSIQAAKNYTLRDNDLVQQALTRLPIEFRGTTLTVSTDQWEDIAGDLQTSVIVTGRVLGANPPGDWSSQPTWNYAIQLDGYQVDPKTGQVTKIYGNTLPYSIYKPPSLVRMNLNYDALYIPAHSVEIPLIASQLHYYDLNPVLLGGHLWQNDSVLQEGAKDVEGAYFTTGFFTDSQQGTTKDFVTAYLQRFAVKPDLIAAQAYDAARLLLKVADTATDRDSLKNGLLSIKDFDGVCGKTTFNGRGEADKQVPIIQIKNGQYQQVQ